MGKPTGPIWIDFSPAIMKLPIESVVQLCNLALNKVSLSDLAVISFEAGLRIDFDLKPTPPRSIEGEGL